MLADDDPTWQPATSRPGELFTPEGQFRHRGHLLRTLQRRGVGWRLVVRIWAALFIGGILLALVLPLVAD